MLEYVGIFSRGITNLVRLDCLEVIRQNARKCKNKKPILTPNTGYWVFIDEVLTIIDQETYTTGVFIDYLLAKISIFLVKRLAFIYVIPYNINIERR